MEKYKQLAFSYEKEINTKTIESINYSLIRQPEPHPYIEKTDAGFIFYFNTLDLNLIQKNIDTLDKPNLFSENEEVEQQLVKEILVKILEEVSKIGSYGIKAGKRKFVDFNVERKVQGRKAKEKNRAQYYYSQGNDFKTENAELPCEFANKIICDDSLLVLKTVPDNSIDLIFTSPPYNFGLDYISQDDAHLWEKYFEKLFQIFDECVRVLKYGGRIIVNIQPLFSDYIPSHHVISNYFMEKKLIWTKGSK